MEPEAAMWVGALPPMVTVTVSTDATPFELVITNSNGVASVDTVTVTMGGKAPTHIAASGSIQAAIDAAKPGDLLIIDPTCTTTAGTVPCTTSTGASGLPAGASTTNAAHN